MKTLIPCLFGHPDAYINNDQGHNFATNSSCSGLWMEIGCKGSTRSVLTPGYTHKVDFSPLDPYIGLFPHD